MAVDKDLFLYDLAVVAIMKNETPYIKEWLDYHIAAGVNHFYIYDDSNDDFREALKPYIEAGIVTYIFYPGTRKQMPAYAEAFKEYRFFCRYMAFIDADEFIYPQSDKSIVEVADEIFSENPEVGGFEINWLMYGSNNLEIADYSKGVLERFTRRAENLELSVKTLCNPRRIKNITSPHFMNYFYSIFRVLENPAPEKYAMSESYINYKLSEKIRINHYRLKSREEFVTKKKLGSGDVAYGSQNRYSSSVFTHDKDNDVFDDSILAYRDARLAKGGGTGSYINYEKLVNALMKEIAPIVSGNVQLQIFEGKLETFLTCRALATYLKEKVLGEQRGAFLEKATLQAIFLAMLEPKSTADTELLISELPNLLLLDYPETEKILQLFPELIEKLKEFYGSLVVDGSKLRYYRNVSELDDLSRLLKGFEHYKQ